MPPKLKRFNKTQGNFEKISYIMTNKRLSSCKTHENFAKNQEILPQNCRIFQKNSSFSAKNVKVVCQNVKVFCQKRQDLTRVKCKIELEKTR